RSLLTESTLAPHIDEVPEQPKLEQDHRIDRRLSGGAVVLLGQAADKSEVDRSRESTHDVVGGNGRVQREAQVELRLDRFGPHQVRYLLLSRARELRSSILSPLPSSPATGPLSPTRSDGARGRVAADQKPNIRRSSPS